MKTFLVIFALLFTLLLTISCGTAKKIEAIKPAPSNANPVVFKNKVSFISMPIEITLKELEQQLKVAHEKKERALSMAQQTKRGHVYSAAIARVW